MSEILYIFALILSSGDITRLDGLSKQCDWLYMWWKLSNPNILEVLTCSDAAIKECEFPSCLKFREKEEVQIWDSILWLNMGDRKVSHMENL